MTLTGLIRLLAIIAIGSFAAACSQSERMAEPAMVERGDPPNIVWIIADDQAYTDFGFMDHEVVKTPNLDRLAASSALFPNGYVPSSLCRASLATLITGKYAFDHGICFNDPPEGRTQADTYRFLQQQTPLPFALQSKGYRSMQTGKFWEGRYTNGGFTDGMTEGGRHGDEGLTIGRETMQPIDDFLAVESDDPFFIWFAPYLPHTPHNAAPEYEDIYAGKGLDQKTLKYYAAISWLDDTVGEMMDLLDKHGEADNTIIMFIVDNGWAPLLDGDSFRDLQGRNLRFDPRSKSSPYEDGVRTPIMISWPGRIQPRRYDDLVSSIDFYPTALAMAAVRPVPGLQGTNLLPFVTSTISMPARDIFGEIYYHTSVDLDDPKVNVTHRWIRRGDMKLIVNDYDDGRAELYNLRADPTERHNLAGDPKRAAEVADMRASIADWWQNGYARKN